MRAVLLVACLLGCSRESEGAPGAFMPPTESQRRQAVGPIDALPPATRRALSPQGFEPLGPPAPGDWLAAHPERGQTFADFVRAGPNRPSPERKTIYLHALGPLPDAAPMDRLARQAEAFFGLPVRLGEPLSVERLRPTERRNPGTGVRQLLTTDILAELRRLLPRDAFCLIAVTDIDLYPDPTWNFVFGQASLRDRVGVFSYARYHAGGEAAEVVLRRAGKVLVHELGHMFGLEHCVYYECMMNGSNHLGETDRRPAHACPVCLHKLLWSVGFDPAERYRALEAFYRDAGLADEARFAAERRAALTE